MIKNLVSILTPCYNTGKLLPRLLDSILMQDYPWVEMYAINDGSSDNTEKVIKEYIPKFEAKGYNLTYVWQENSGQSVAINNALKLVKGEFLVWPDSDDFYATPSAISKMVDVLQKEDDSVSMVRCLAEFVDEESLQVIRRYSPTTRTEWFEDCLFAKAGFWFCPGGYMIKMNILDRVLEGREIYTEKNAGQNWQLLLPLLYEQKCITINEYHYKILERAASHSRGQYKSLEEQLCKFQSYENTIVSTLEKMRFMPMELKQKYIADIHIKYLLVSYRLCLDFKEYKRAKTVKETLASKYHVQIPVMTCIKIYLSPLRRFIKKLLLK